MRIQAGLLGAPLASAMLIVAACSSPTKPTSAEPFPPVISSPDLADTVWTGYVRITSCTSPSGCQPFVNAMYAFTLGIEDTGGSWTADLDSSTPDAYHAHLPGHLEADGTFVFSGTSADGSVTVQRLTLRKDAVAGLSGTMQYTAGPPPGNPYGDETRTFDAVIPSAVAGRDLRQPGPGDSLDMAGTWAGTGRLDACAGPVCGRQLPDPGPFSITVMQAGDQFSALLVSDIFFTTVAHLTGTTQPDGSVRFAGPSGPGDLAGEFRFFTVRVDPSLGLTGRFEFVLPAPVGVTTFEGTILSAARAVSIGIVQPFQGYWAGDYIPRSCVGDCAHFGLDRPTPHPLQLSLSQAGASVQGDALEVPVSGTAAGNTLSLQGERIVDPCVVDPFEGSTCTQRLTRFSATLDEFGELHGSLEYFEEGWRGQLHYRYTVTADLANVVRHLQ